MTGRINSFRQAVLDTIRARMPELGSAELQFGRFDLDELERTSFKTPALRVAVLSAPISPQAEGDGEAMLKCAAFFVTDGKSRDETGWDLAEAAATLCHSGQLWGLTRLLAPEKVNIQAVVTGSLRSRGVSIIAVEWQQTLRKIGDGVFTEEGFLAPELYVNDEPFEAPEAPDEPA